MMGMYIFSPVLACREQNVVVANKIACRLGYEGEMEDRKKLLHFFKKIKMEPLIVLRLEHYFNTV